MTSASPALLGSRLRRSRRADCIRARQITGVVLGRVFRSRARAGESRGRQQLERNQVSCRGRRGHGGGRPGSRRFRNRAVQGFGRYRNDRRCDRLALWGRLERAVTTKDSTGQPASSSSVPIALVVDCVGVRFMSPPLRQLLDILGANSNVAIWTDWRFERCGSTCVGFAT